MVKTSAIKGLEQIFEKNLNDEYLDKAIFKIISYEINKTKKELEELNKELDLYEKQFNMKSEEFFRKFDRGELGDNADFFEWSSLYKMSLRISERLSILMAG